MTNLDSIWKSRDITLPKKVQLVKAMVFPVVMYGCESSTIKKAECRRTDAFELWCWKKLLRVPGTARRFNQSILKEIGPEYSMDGLMLKLKLQYFGHLCEELTHWKRPRCCKRLKAGEGDDRGWDGWMASPTWWTWVWADSRSWWWTGKPGVLQSMRSQRVRHDWATELNWSTIDGIVKWYVHAQLLKSYQILCNPIDCSLPGSLVHQILQARILVWATMPSSRGSSWPRDWTWVSCCGKLYEKTK